MGQGPSYENEFREAQKENERSRKQAEEAINENKRMQAEIKEREEKRAKEEKEKEMKREKEEAKRVQEAQRVLAEKHKEIQKAQEEKERIQAESYAKELKRAEEEKAKILEAHRVQVEKERVQAEKERAQTEKHRKEMQKAQEEREKLRKEKERIQTENHAKELRRAEEEKAKILEAQRIQAEKDKALAEKHEMEMRVAQEERERLQKEKERIQAENYEKELRRMKAEEGLRRAEEEKKKLEEAHRMQEELRRLQEKIRMEEERREMEDLARKTEEQAKKRVEQEIWLRKEAERNLEKGIPEVKYPTGEEFQAMRKKHGYQEGYLHIAITGISGSGKSSLVNAVRGCSNSTSPKPNIARTGTSETTEEIERYYDPDPSRPWLVWYDVPGAGTVKVRDWQYFNNQGLYIFDVIIIVVGDRFTNTDVELLFHCKRFGIPAFVVRSKADMHITNNIDDDGDDGDDSYENRFIRAREKFITDTRKDFDSLLQGVGLPQQKVYIVSKNTLRHLIKGSKSAISIIDDMELMDDVIHAASERHQSLSQRV